MQKGNNRGLAARGSDCAFGDFAMQASEPGRITSRQIEAARMAITRHVKRAGKLWIRVFPDHPVTKKPLEVRMGGGKGGVEYWAADVLPGRVMFEIAGVDEKTAREAFRLAGHKLPVGYKFLIRGVGDVEGQRPARANSAKTCARLEEERSRGTCSRNRFKNFTNRLDDTSTIRKSKKDLARVKTVLAAKNSGLTPVAADATEATPKAQEGRRRQGCEDRDGRRLAAMPAAKADKKKTPAKKSEAE